MEASEVEAEVICVVGVVALRIEEDVVRPDEAPVAAQNVEIALAGARNVVFGDDESR
jgi:hypothetical protein